MLLCRKAFETLSPLQTSSDQSTPTRCVDPAVLIALLLSLAYPEIPGLLYNYPVRTDTGILKRPPRVPCYHGYRKMPFRVQSSRTRPGDGLCLSFPHGRLGRTYRSPTKQVHRFQLPVVPIR